MGIYGDSIFLNEGVIDLLKKIYNKMKKYSDDKEAQKKKSQDKLKNKDNNQIQSKPYSQSEYDKACKWIKDIIKEYHDGTIYESLTIWGDDLFYLDISESNFTKNINKIFKNDSELVARILDASEEDDDGNIVSKETIDFCKNNECMIVGKSYSGGKLVYFRKYKKFMIFTNYMNPDKNNLLNYSDLLKLGKETLINSSSKSSNEAMKQADIDLGYYRLSSPPEGATVNKI